MTSDRLQADPGAGSARSGGWPGSLRVRLLLAFTAVAVAAIALVAAAAAVGADRGLSAQAAADRQQLAERAAAEAAKAYARRGGWKGADLGPIVAIASGAGARVFLSDPDGNAVMRMNGHGMNGQGIGGQGIGGQGMNSQGMNSQGIGGAGTNRVLAPVQVAGESVGTVTLVFPGYAHAAGRPVAWAWVGAAALAALALAVAAAWLITRMLTRPLAVLTTTARAIAAGDRGARSHLDTHGELGELAAAFDTAAEQIQLSERARRQLSADVAHELRTPLAALQAGLEELRDGLVPADAAALARLHDQTLRLGRVVADLAELSAADAARLTLRHEPVDLAVIAAETADALSPSLRSAGLVLERRLDTVHVEGDPQRLHQIVANLLQNCARHCRPGDSVTLTVTPDAATRTAQLTVRDTGPGISPDDLPHVFTRFWRSDRSSGSSGTGGSGLGMAIVRSLVEAHGGSVHVQSDGRTGTEVMVEFPARAEHQPSAPYDQSRNQPTLSGP